MTNQRGPEDRIFDAAVNDAWRDASNEQPAPQFDAAILAAARAEARTAADASRQRRRASWRTFWQPLAAAAGVACLAFLLVKQIPIEPVAPDAAPAAAPRQASEPVAEESAERVGDLAAPAAEPSPTAPPLPAQAAPPAPAVTAVPPVSAEAAAPRSPAPAARYEAGLASAKSEADATSPEDRVRRIIELYESGNFEAAADELRALRGAYRDADAQLPDTLREWASTVNVDDAR